MKIYNNFPESFAFKKNEFKTLEYIRNWGLIGSPFETLSSALNKCYEQHYNVDFSIYPFELQLDFPMEIQDHIHRVVVGANIRGSKDINSYYLAICDAKEEQIIRKFHFDFALPDIKTLQRVPTFHLQYGGKSTQYIKDKNWNDDKIDSWLSVPRLSFMPMNLALLLDLIFCEFTNKDAKNIHEDSRWRTLVLDNEKFLYFHYLTNIHTHMQSSRYNNKYLLRDLYYGN